MTDSTPRACRRCTTRRRLSANCPSWPRRKCHSGAGHTATTARPLTYEQIADNRWVVDGTPVDCVRVALRHLNLQADWLLAGVNAGANLGVDVYYSGTAAAAREAAMLGCRAAAVSHYRLAALELDWRQAETWTARLLRSLLERTEIGGFWNINLPHLDDNSPEPQSVECPLDLNPLPVAYRSDEQTLHYVGRYPQRERTTGADVDVCFSGDIAISWAPL